MGHLFLATHGGDVILMIDNRPRAWRLGTDVWYVDGNGDFSGPSSFIKARGGRLLGVFPDGSLVVMLPRQWGDSTRVFSTVVFRPQQQASPSEVLPFLVAAPTDPTRTTTPAWAHSPNRTSGVAGDTIWIVPTERPELLAVHRSGDVLLRIEWEAGDRGFPPTTSDAWDHQIWDGAERFPAAGSLMIGTDGLVYVKCWYGQEWLVFSPSGDLIGQLELPRGWRVLAFGDRSVLAGITNYTTRRREVRVHGLTESGVTTTGS